jgi:hypothetical protein
MTVNLAPSIIIRLILQQGSRRGLGEIWPGSSQEKVLQSIKPGPEPHYISCDKALWFFRIDF